MWIGINIGGTACSASLGYAEDDRLVIAAAKKIPTRGSAREIFDALAALTQELLQQEGNPRITAVGISCGGPLDSKTGVVQSPPNLPGWDNVPIVQWAEETWGVPARLCNDANAAALAEWRFGAGVGTQDMLFLTCGTGIGAGLILDGRLYEGFTGMAGEIGHVRLENMGPVGYGKAGSVEGLCSGSGIARIGCMIAQERAQQGLSTGYVPEEGLSAVTAKCIAEAAFAGDETAKEVYRISGEALGRALAILCDVLNPQRIVLGSVYMRSGQLLEEAIWTALRKEALPACLRGLEIVPGRWGEELGDAAALTVAAELDKQA